jgi:hypothetical protein
MATYWVDGGFGCCGAPLIKAWRRQRNIDQISRWRRFVQKIGQFGDVLSEEHWLK